MLNLLPLFLKHQFVHLTLILPISEAILDPTLPANINDIIVGENSKIKESLLAKPIKYLGSKGFCKFNAVCILTTPPTKNDINIQFQLSLNLFFLILNYCF